MSPVPDPSVPLPSTLRIRFRAGERPHLFWVTRWHRDPTERYRFKVLSKARADRTIEVIVLREGERMRRQPLVHLELPADVPSGWLERWIDTLSTELGTRFESFDLRDVGSADEWRRVAARLGWLPLRGGPG
ncbi:MAG: hypothetical protein ACE5FG_07440 [Myxococcota bacterium]